MGQVKRAVRPRGIVGRIAAEKGITRATFTERSGIDHTMVGRYWRGDIRVGEKNLRLVATALEISVDELLRRQESRSAA
jgi:transcriptional regulator with XRE-family HTH domain